MKPAIRFGIRSEGICLPSRRIRVAGLVARGRLSRESARSAGYVSLAQASSAREASGMALQAARRALRRARLSGRDVDLVVFSTALLKERGYWCASADLCRRLNARAEFLDLYQGCNGVMSAVDYAAAKFAADPKLRNALVVASEYLPERFAPKWSWDSGAYYGDGAGAWVLSSERPRFFVRAIASRFLPELSGFIWISHGSYAALESRGRGVTPRDAKRRYLLRHGLRSVQKRIEEGSRRVIEELLRDAGLERETVDLWILQNFSADLLDRICAELGLPREKTSCDMGRDTGHIGSVDPILNLYRATNGARAMNPRNILLLTHGAGFSIMGMILSDRATLA